MSSISLLTSNFKTLIAKQVLSLLDDSKNEYLTPNGDSLPDSELNYIYVVLGRQLPWTNTEAVIVPQDSNEYFIQSFRNGIYARRLTLENSTLVVPRVDWTANSVYNTYQSFTNFYVLNSKNQVFKCLDNNLNSISTVEPEITLTTTSLDEPFLKTSDGYKWKYLYTIYSSQKQKFLTDDWMPVYSNEFVKNQAISRSIDVVQITNAGFGYIDSPTSDIITIDGDGSGAILKANVENGNVVDIVIQSRGQDYTYANLSFETDIGSNAAAIVKLAPEGGHGFDPVSELRAKTFMVNVDFAGNESLHPVNNEYRQAFLLHNPQTSNSSVASASSYTLYTKILVSGGSGDFNEDEVVYQGTSLSDATFTAEVIYFDSINNQLYVNNVRGQLETNRQIVGNVTGSIRVAVEKEDPTMKLFSGDILYITNKTPIQRDVDQTDRIQFILGF